MQRSFKQIISTEPFSLSEIGLVNWTKLGFSAEENTTAFRSETVIGMSFILLFLMAVLVLNYVNLRRSRINLQKMTDVARRFRAGERDLRIQSQPGSNFSHLAQSINELADTVNSREAELFEQREHLEEVVLERTRDLVKEVRERKSAENQVKMIVESAMEGIISADSIGNILSFNPAATTIFGYSQNEVVNKNLNILMPNLSADKEDNFITSYMSENRKLDKGERGAELVSRRKSGEEFIMELAISQFQENNQSFYTLIVRDITERKEYEEKLQDTLNTLQLMQTELVQSEKMASLGSLVAGVAHEINTPIGVGVTAASHLQEKATKLTELVKDGKLSKKDFDLFLGTATKSTKIILSNLVRASDLIKSFKQVAVDQSSEAKRSFYLIEYIEEILVSLQPQLKWLKHKIFVHGDRAIYIESYPGPLAQIVTNLVMNSVIHAFSDHEAGKIHISVTLEAGHIVASFKDDGQGMDAETVSKVFDPFFTTKRGSGGSGLGMHILFNQVTQSLDGTIKCNSILGEGTEFIFTFPYEEGK